MEEHKHYVRWEMLRWVFDHVIAPLMPAMLGIAVGVKISTVLRDGIGGYMPFVPLGVVVLSALTISDTISFIAKGTSKTRAISLLILVAVLPGLAGAVLFTTKTSFAEWLWWLITSVAWGILIFTSFIVQLANAKEDLEKNKKLTKCEREVNRLKKQLENKKQNFGTPTVTEGGKK